MGNEHKLNVAKSEKFKSLSEHRVNQILDKIRILGNLANKSNYQYSQEEVAKMFRVIEKELRETKDKFSPKGNKKNQRKFKW